MVHRLHHDRMINLFTRALAGGAKRLTVTSAEWNIAGNCSNPWHSLIMGRPAGKGDDLARPLREHVFDGGRSTMYLDLWTRCRACENCAKARQSEWRWRANYEVRMAARSWFGTLTLSPIEQYRMLSIARHQAHTRGVPWNELTDDQRFSRVANTSLKEVTKYIKRVRKEAAVPFRYICVTEKHKSGLPHFHMLLHESELKPVRHKTLSTQWSLGFEKWRLVPFDDNPKAANYVCKYLSKSAKLRIRASVRYGREQVGIVGPLLASIKDQQID